MESLLITILKALTESGRVTAVRQGPQAADTSGKEQHAAHTFPLSLYTALASIALRSRDAPYISLMDITPFCENLLVPTTSQHLLHKSF
jgi:hypothetical protein